MSETLVVRAEIAELARVRDWVESFGPRFGLGQSTLYAIHLCFEEAISNIVRYAFPDTDGHHQRRAEVRLSVKAMGNAIVLTIEDDGRPFNPLSVSPPSGPTSIEAISAGGWGIHLMRKFARSLSYQRQDDVNRLTLRFDPYRFAQLERRHSTANHDAHSMSGLGHNRSNAVGRPNESSAT